MISMTKYRGHEIDSSDGQHWIYSDTQQPVSDCKDRPCGHCGLSNTAEGHDGCLGTLPGVMNACCGHGSIDNVYVQYWNGESIHGDDAAREINHMIKGVKQ